MLTNWKTYIFLHFSLRMTLITTGSIAPSIDIASLPFSVGLRRRANSLSRGRLSSPYLLKTCVIFRRQPARSSSLVSRLPLRSLSTRGEGFPRVIGLCCPSIASNLAWTCSKITPAIFHSSEECGGTKEAVHWLLTARDRFFRHHLFHLPEQIS